MQEKTKRNLANLALLCAGAIWGGGFVVMKNALDAIPVNWLLFFRFLIGGLGLGFSLLRNPRAITRRLLWQSAVVGLLLYLAFAVQTYGLMFTSAGKNALITAFYVILVPLFGWVFQKKRPEKRVLAAALLMLLGVTLLCWNKEGGINIGDLLTFLCSILYAVEIMAVDKYEQGVDILQFSSLQLLFAALFAAVPALLFEPIPRAWTADMISALAYCGLGATLLAMTFMNVGIRYASPNYASLLMSTESAFGVVFGILFLDETLHARAAAGCAAVLLALCISQLDLGMLRKKKGVRHGI